MGTNRKIVPNYLLVNNSSLGPSSLAAFQRYPTFSVPGSLPAPIQAKRSGSSAWS